MANQQGFSAAGGAGDLAKLLHHYDRTKLYDKDGNLRYEQYPNLTQRGFDKTYNQSQIDVTRTHLNYNLHHEHEGGQQAFIERRLSEVYVHKSALKNAMVDWVITLPDLPQYHGREREFFEVCYRRLCQKYGSENVVSAYVHMDEKQPHMHFAFLPIVQDLKHEQGWRLSRKAVNTVIFEDDKGKTHQNTKNFSKAFHKDLDAAVRLYMHLGGPSGIRLTEEQREKRTIKENMRSVPELREAEALLEQAQREAGTWEQTRDVLKEQAHRAQEDRDNARVEAAEARQSLEEAQGEVSALEARKEGLEAEISATSDRLERLRRGEGSLEAEVAGLRAAVAEREAAPLEPARESLWQSAGTLVGNRSLGEREQAARVKSIELGAREERCIGDIQRCRAELPDIEREARRLGGQVLRLESARARLAERVGNLEQGVSRIIGRVREFSPLLPQHVRDVVERLGGKVMSVFEWSRSEAIAASRDQRAQQRSQNRRWEIER